MTIRALRLPAFARTPRATDLLWGAGVALTAIVAGKYVAAPTFSRAMFALAALSVVAGIGIRNPRPLLLGLPIWLVALGFVRRIYSGVSAAGAADPLLLVAPVAVIVLVFAAADRGAFRNPTRLSKLVVLYSVFVCFGAVNPLQGSTVAGATALIFFVPILAFWIGRGFVDAALLRRLLIVIGVAAVPAALYGLRQTFVGFPSWDRTWIASQGYAALSVGKATRPFSTFSSSAEYATFLAIAMLVWLRLGPRRLLRPIAVAVVGLLAVAVFYQSSRGTIVMLLAGGTVMLAAWRRLPLAAAAAVGAVFLLLLPAVVKHFAPTTYSDTSSSSLVQHQVQGLSNPLDPNSSTAGAHFSLIVEGVRSAFHNPLGQGISAVTISGAKFGGVTNGTEADPSNAAVALGIPGLLLFVALFLTGFAGAYRLARSGDRLAGVAVGILTVTSMQWLNGAQYAVAFIPWLVLGWIDAQLLEHEPVPAERDVETRAQQLSRSLPPRPLPVLPRRPVVEPPAAPPPTPPAPVARVWNVFALERAVGLDHYKRLVLIYLRSYASMNGELPLEFDGLVRDVFGELPT